MAQAVTTMTDPDFWTSLGAGEAFAAFMSFVILGLLALLGYVSKEGRREAKAWEGIHSLVLQLSHVPQDIETIKDNQEDFKRSMRNVETAQAAMSRDIEWLKRQRSK